MHPSTARLHESAYLLRGAVGTTEIGNLIGESPQTVQNWARRGVSKGGAIKAQKAFGVRAAWIISGEGRMTDDPAPGGMAQPVSPQEFTLPPSINREQLMNVNFTLPPLFLMTMPDEALQDTTPKGIGLIMQTVPPSHRPPPGRVVLARDGAGTIFVRRFGEGDGERWRAMATNPAYRDLDSEAANLTLVAVLRWVAGEDH